MTCVGVFICINAIPMSDHWKVVAFELYIKWYENGYIMALYFSSAWQHYLWGYPKDNK